MADSTLKAVYKDITSGPLGIFGALFLGAIANKSHASAAVVAALGAAAALVRFLALIWAGLKTRFDAKRRAREFIALREPDPEASSFADSHGHEKAVIGRVIEIWAHHSLESMSSPYDLGIDPNTVVFSQPRPKDFSLTLAECGGLKSFPKPSRLKYGIRKLPIGTMDDENFVVDFFETDNDTWMSVRTRVERDVDLRHRLADISPERSRLPQSMSLQFIVRFNNGSILAMKRKEGLLSEPGAWSLSGEEQLSQSDFRSQAVSVPEFLFRRAFIEEVFGHRGTDETFVNRIWIDDCLPKIRSHRIWSFFLEENVGIFQTFGVYQLNIQPDELRSIHKAAVSAGWGSTDPEGRWYVMRERDIIRLLRDGSCEAYRLHGKAESAKIQANALHATSRYRLWRLYTAFHRQRGKTMTALNLR